MSVSSVPFLPCSHNWLSRTIKGRERLPRHGRIDSDHQQRLPHWSRCNAKHHLWPCLCCLPAPSNSSCGRQIRRFRHVILRVGRPQEREYNSIRRRLHHAENVVGAATRRWHPNHRDRLAAGGAIAAGVNSLPGARGGEGVARPRVGHRRENRCVHAPADRKRREANAMGTGLVFKAHWLVSRSQ